MKKLLSVFLTLTMLLSAAALAVPTTASAASKTGKKYVSYKSIRKIIKREGRVILDGKIKYPKLKAKTKVAKKLNKYFKNKVTFAAERIAKQAKEDYAENGFDSFDYMGTHYQYDISAKLVYNAKNKYSFKYTDNEYLMGAHGSVTVTGYNFSKKTGKQIPITKLTKYSNKTLKNKIVAKLKKEIKKNPSKYFDNALESVKARKISQFVFYLSGKYLCVHFNDYEIAPFSAGHTVLKIKL